MFPILQSDSWLPCTGRQAIHVRTEVAAFGQWLLWRRREAAFASAHIQLVKDSRCFCCNVPCFPALSLSLRITVVQFSILPFLTLLQFAFCGPAAVPRFPWISFLSGLCCPTGEKHLGLLQVELMVTPLPKTVAQHLPL